MICFITLDISLNFVLVSLQNRESICQFETKYFSKWRLIFKITIKLYEVFTLVKYSCNYFTWLHETAFQNRKSIYLVLCKADLKFQIQKFVLIIEIVIKKKIWNGPIFRSFTYRKFFKIFIYIFFKRAVTRKSSPKNNSWQISGIRFFRFVSGPGFRWPVQEQIGRTVFWLSRPHTSQWQHGVWKWFFVWGRSLIWLSEGVQWKEVRQSK